jgi:hypothetical protein
MIPEHLEILLKLKVAEVFGKVSVIEKNNKNITTIHYKNIIPDTSHHHNNLIGKIVCTKFDFYYIPLTYIDNYEQKKEGLSICHTIDICPFCSGIILESELESKYYKMMKKKELVMNLDNDPDIDLDSAMTISDDIYKVLKKYFCFELIK